jgi:hypothetical protein
MLGGFASCGFAFAVRMRSANATATAGKLGRDNRERIKGDDRMMQIGISTIAFNWPSIATRSS